VGELLADARVAWLIAGLVLGWLAAPASV